jgi:hypothetical protein
MQSLLSELLNVSVDQAIQFSFRHERSEHLTALHAVVNEVIPICIMNGLKVLIVQAVSTSQETLNPFPLHHGRSFTIRIFLRRLPHRLQTS